MKYVLLVSHGGLSQGLKSTLSMFAGDKIAEVRALSLEPDQSVDEFGKVCRESLADLGVDDSVVVLADIVGGSPLTTLCGVLDDLGKLDTATVLGGMNLPMALTTLVMKDALQGSDLASAVLAEAGSALQEFVIESSDADDEDDDI
ncbi:PTS sugar transporter subunit IIA [Streptococcus caprae]|uniref:PTS sugar transporter subunit IIA n=1 Tax=Streptococcus caprae TaxID=1640501 RepID=A0ABV8CSX1_9STRE